MYETPTRHTLSYSSEPCIVRETDERRLILAKIYFTKQMRNCETTTDSTNNII
jgi:hypothetical protein